MSKIKLLSAFQLATVGWQHKS